MRNKLMFTTALLLAGFGTAAAQNNAGAQGSTRQPTAQQTQDQSRQAPGAQRNNGGEERRGAQSGNRRETTGQAPSSGKDESRSQHGEKNAAESGRNSSAPTNSQTKSPGNQSEQGAARDSQQRNQNVGREEERRNSQQETNPRTGQQEPRTGQQDNGPRTGQREGSEGDRANNPRGDKNTTTGQTGQNEREPRNGSVMLSSEQQTRIRDTVLSSRNVPRVDDVRFAINVGSRVPTDIRIVEVPTALIDIHPEWRNDSYFVVRDEIVIVDGGRNIVATVPVGSSNARLENRDSRTSVNLSSAEIREIQAELQRQGFEIGEVDGVMGARTREAVIAFQKRSGFQATGEIDRDTFSALSEKKGNAGPAERGGQQGNADTGRGENPSRSPSQAQTSNPRENSKASSQNASPKDASSDRESGTTGQGNGGDKNSPASQNPRRNENQR